jgi:hypothetical protein
MCENTTDSVLYLNNANTERVRGYMAHTEQCHAFVLRLPNTDWKRASESSNEDGISINHFISIAVAERLMRLELRRESHLAGSPGRQ